MERGFPEHQSQFAFFLELNIGGPDQQVFIIGMGDPGQGFHRARRHYHAHGLKGPAGNGCGNLLIVISEIRHSQDLVHIIRCFDFNIEFSGLGNNQMRFNIPVFQDFQHPDAIDDTACSGHSHD